MASNRDDDDDDDDDDAPFFDAVDSLSISQLSVERAAQLQPSQPQPATGALPVNSARLLVADTAAGSSGAPPTSAQFDEGGVLLIRNLDTGQFVPVSELEAKLSRPFDPVGRNLMQRSKLVDAVSIDNSDDESEYAADGQAASAQGPTAENKSSSGKKNWFRKLTSSSTKSGAGSDNKANETKPNDEEDLATEGNQRFMKSTTHHKDKRELDRLVHVQDVEGHPGGVWAIRFSSDGRYLASGGADAIVRLWAILGEPKSAESSQSSPAIVSPVPLVQTAHGGATATATTPSAPISDRPDSGGPRTPTPTQSKRRSQENLSAPIFPTAPVRIYRGHEADVLDVAWSQTNFILSASLDKTVRLWHASRPECLLIFQHTDVVVSAVFHPKDDKHFLSGSLDGKLRKWSVPEKRVVSYNELPESAPITAVAFSHQGDVAVAGTYAGTCFMYTTEKLKYNTQLYVRSSRGRNKGKKITGIEVTPNDDKILVSSNDSRLRVYHLNDKSLFCKYKGHTNINSHIRATYSDDGRYIVSGSEDNRVFLWQANQTVQQPSGEGLFSSFRRDLNESFETFEATISPNTITATAIAPAKLRPRLEEHMIRLPPLTPAKGAYGMFIVVGNSSGQIRVYENDPPPPPPPPTTTAPITGTVGMGTSSTTSGQTSSGSQGKKEGERIKGHIRSLSNPFQGFPLLQSSDTTKNGSNAANAACPRCGGTQLKIFEHNKDTYTACLRCSVSWRD